MAWLLEWRVPIVICHLYDEAVVAFVAGTWSTPEKHTWTDSAASGSLSETVSALTFGRGFKRGNCGSEWNSGLAKHREKVDAFNALPRFAVHVGIKTHDSGGISMVFW